MGGTVLAKCIFCCGYISNVLPLPLQGRIFVCTGHTSRDLYVLCIQKCAPVTVKEVHLGNIPAAEDTLCKHLAVEDWKVWLRKGLEDWRVWLRKGLEDWRVWLRKGLEDWKVWWRKGLECWKFGVGLRKE